MIPWVKFSPQRRGRHRLARPERVGGFTAWARRIDFMSPRQGWFVEENATVQFRPPAPEGVAVMGENLTASELGEKATGSGEGHR
jgi:hypothetical protein